MEARDTPASDLCFAFRAALRWEKPIEMVSTLSPEGAIKAIKMLVDDDSGWRSIVPFAMNKPLRGSIVATKGSVICRDRMFQMRCLRRLWFSISAADNGSKLCGVLKLRTSVQMWEIAMLLFAFGQEIVQIYWAFAAIKPNWPGIAWRLIRPVLAGPILWLLVRSSLWFGRKQEQKMLELIGDALNPLCAPDMFRPRPASATEVFIRPRHQQLDK